MHRRFYRPTAACLFQVIGARSSCMRTHPYCLRCWVEKQPSCFSPLTADCLYTVNILTSGVAEQQPVELSSMVPVHACNRLQNRVITFSLETVIHWAKLLTVCLLLQRKSTTSKLLTMLSKSLNICSYEL